MWPIGLRENERYRVSGVGNGGERGAAKAGVPAKPTRMRRARRFSRRAAASCAAGREARALQRRQVFDEDLAEQMVHFVLDTHGEHAFGVQLERFATLVLRAHADSRGARHLVVVAGNGQAAFLALGFAFGRQDLGIDEYPQVVAGLGDIDRR